MKLVFLLLLMPAITACKTNPSSERRIIVPIWDLDR